MRLLVIGRLCVGLAASLNIVAAASALRPRHEKSEVWRKESLGYTIFKVPTLVTDREGRMLLAIAEGRVSSIADDAHIRLVLRRSSDAGRTWSDMTVVHEHGTRTVGNPTPVLDRETGTIWLFFCIDNREVWVTSTSDAGLTWTKASNLSGSIQRPEQTRFYVTGPGHGIQLQRGPKRGRLLIAAYASQKEMPPHTAVSKSFAIYSDDHGLNWTAGQVTQESAPGSPDGNECMATELSDGRLYLTIRNNLTRDGRGYALSGSAGLDWTTVRLDSQLPEAVCEASIISAPASESRLTHYYAAPSVNLLVRGAYARTLGRPDLNFIVPGAGITDPLATNPLITVNNPGLAPWTANNYDLSLESYYLKDGFGTVGVFQKDIKNFFNTVTTPATRELLAQYGLDNDPLLLDYDIRTQENGGSARIRGVEFGYRQSLTFLPRWARELQLFVNYTKLDLDGDRTADFDGFNPEVLSGGVNFIRERYYLKVTVASTGELQRASVAPNAANGIPANTFDFQAARTRWSVTGQYSFSRRFALYGSIIDVGGLESQLKRYDPNTPEYARTSVYQKLGYFLTLGVKGSA